MPVNEDRRYPAYPADDEPILGHFDCYESAAVLLHPFYKLAPDAPSIDGYPSDAVVARHASPVRWSDICSLLEFSTLSRLNTALLSSIGALQREFAAPQDAELLSQALSERRECLSTVPFHVCSVRAPDDSLLAIVHWDSFLTLLLGSASSVGSALKRDGVEGFRCPAWATHSRVFELEREAVDLPPN